LKGEHKLDRSQVVPVFKQHSMKRYGWSPRIFLPGKQSLMATEQKAWCAPQPVWTWWQREKSLSARAGNQFQLHKSLYWFREVYENKLFRKTCEPKRYEISGKLGYYMIRKVVTYMPLNTAKTEINYITMDWTCNSDGREKTRARV
jgi:hypothetical protein